MFANDEILIFKYKFIFSDGKEKEFTLKLDSNTMGLIKDKEENYPEWTKLSHFKCPHCPLNSFTNEYCPVAINLVDIISEFNNVPSYEKVRIEVSTNERGYFKNTDIQSGVSSLIGILMPTSGCPIMSKLKPLVRFHLPFASLEETEFKVFSMFLIAQFMRKTVGKEPDWELTELQEMYDNIKILNQNVASRIADLEAKDASINAVVVLNNFADFVTFSIEEKDLSNFKLYFKEYLNEN